MKIIGRIGLWMVCLGGVSSEGMAAERFPFVLRGDDIEPTATDFSGLHPRPAGGDGFVTIRDGRFFTGDRRLRIWGMNVCFAANSPDKSDSPTIAARLSKLGINGIRFHHHDSAPPPRGLLRPPEDGRRVLDPELMDRQDFFLDQLARHGIYANLNLHVGRAFTPAEGFPVVDRPYEFRYDKFILYFEPRMRELFKEFIRDYLGRVNPYREIRRADDPAIAMIEITNENSFSIYGPSRALLLPEPNRMEFQRQMNAWLLKKYGSTAALRKAWLAQVEPPGEILARLDGAVDPDGVWKLRTVRAAPGRMAFGEPGPRGKANAVRVILNGAGTSSSDQELSVSGLSLKKDRAYTLSLSIRAEARREVFADVSRTGAPDWSSLGFASRLEAGPEWETHSVSFRAKDDADRGARICFKFGESDVDFWLADVVLREGGAENPLPLDQTLEAGSVAIPPAGGPEPAVADARAFMEDVEAEFIRDITDFIKRDVGAKMPVTASQINYHGPKIVADTCEFADVHAYWHHPRFPGKPWDRKNWLIVNTPMEAVLGRDAMLGRAPLRLLDRPYTMSEWNIPSPHDYAASVVPFAALVAALQDWDGVFFFQYASEEGNWLSDGVDNYFSFKGHPVKLALLGAFANLYVRGDLAPLPAVAAGTFDALAPAGLGISRRIGIDPGAAAPAKFAVPEDARLASDDGRVVWDATDSARAHVRVDTPATKAIWGLVGDRDHSLGCVSVRVGSVDRDYAAIVLTSLDGAPIETSKRMLLVAVGSAENAGAGWNEARNSVGDQWGRGPAQVNGIPADISVSAPVKAVHALDATGRRQNRVEVRRTGKTSSWSIGPGHTTLWYEIESE